MKVGRWGNPGTCGPNPRAGLPHHPNPHTDDTHPTHAALPTVRNPHRQTPTPMRQLSTHPRQTTRTTHQPTLAADTPTTPRPRRRTVRAWTRRMPPNTP